MKMEIDINEYIDKDELKEIVKNAIYFEIEGKIKSQGIDKMIDNIAYEMLISIISKEYADKLKDSIFEKMDKTIDKGMEFYAFYEGRHLDKLMKDTIRINNDTLTNHMMKKFMSQSYDEKVLSQIQRSSEDMMGNIYDLVEALSKNKNQ